MEAGRHEPPAARLPQLAAGCESRNLGTHGLVRTARVVRGHCADIVSGVCTSVILPRSVVQELTGYVRPSAQARWLRANKWKFTINGKNEVIVFSLEYIRKKGMLPEPPMPAILPIESLRQLPRDIPTRQGGGIYFLWLQDELHYIGQTKWFGERIGTHEYQGRIPFDRCTFIVCGEFHRLNLETAYIRAYEPPYNRR